MKVIDFRFRPNTPEIINGIKNSTMFKAACEVIGFDQRKPQPLDEIVADLDAMGVELGVITGRDAETTYGFPANNNSVLEFCRAYPNKFVGLWGIDPHKKMAAVREIEKVVKEYGMKGIAIDPYLAHMPASDARFYPLYTKCCELDVPVFITMAPPPCVPGAILEYADPRADPDHEPRRLSLRGCGHLHLPAQRQCLHGHLRIRALSPGRDLCEGHVHHHQRQGPLCQRPPLHRAA